MASYANENISIRNKIAKNYDIINDAINNKMGDNFYNLYFLFKGNNKLLGSLYAISYIIKKDSNNEKDVKECKRLKKIIKDKTMKDSLDIITFCDMCIDNINFRALKREEKRRLFKNVNEDDFLKENIELFNYDFLYHVLFFNKNMIMNEYNKNCEQFNGFDEILDETTINMSYFIDSLKDEDFLNYVKIFDELSNIYYKYNTYLFENGIEIKTNSIEKTLLYTRMIDMKKEEFLKESFGNSDIMDSFIKDYVKYEILSKEVKDKINNIDIDIKNRDFNIIIREVLWKYFSDADIYDEENIKKFNKYTDIMKENEIFDDVVDIIYNDSYSMISYEYLINKNKDFESEYRYIKDFNDIDEFKMALLEDNTILINYILYSSWFYEKSFLEKKNYLYDLNENGIYDDCLNDVYKDDLKYYNSEYSVSFINRMYKEVNKDYVYETLESIKTVKSVVMIDLLTLKESNKSKYFDIMYDILKEYQIYKISVESNNFYKKDELILNELNTNLYSFIDSITSDDLDYILNEYLYYLSLPLEQKEFLNRNFDEKDKKGKVKLIKRKNS